MQEILSTKLINMLCNLCNPTRCIPNDLQELLPALRTISLDKLYFIIYDKGAKNYRYCKCGGECESRLSRIYSHTIHNLHEFKISILFADCLYCMNYYIAIADKIRNIKYVNPDDTYENVEKIHICNKADMIKFITTISDIDAIEIVNNLFPATTKSANAV